MTKVKNAALALISVAALSVPSISMAQMTMKGPDSGWYVGAQIGQADVDRIGEKDTSFTVLGGHQINRNFAAELGYTDFGKAEVGGATFKGTALELSGLGILPINDKFSVYGKLGIARTEAKVSGGGTSAKEDSFTPTYGFGGQYNVSPTFGIRAQWQRYDVGDGNASSDVDVLSVGVIFRFK